MSFNVFNFDINFTNCFKKNKSKNKYAGIDIEDIIDTLTDMEYLDKIKLLMLKICNGTYDKCILFEHDEQQIKILNMIGGHDINCINYYNVISIPIFKNNGLRYSLTLIKNTKIKNIHNDEYVKLLTGILH
jgi:hypothetical protein